MWKYTVGLEVVMDEARVHSSQVRGHSQLVFSLLFLANSIHLALDI